MPFTASCFCTRHDEWKHGDVDSEKLRQCTNEESALFATDPKSKGRKRKICIYCRSRLELESKCRKLEVIICSYLLQDVAKRSDIFVQNSVRIRAAAAVWILSGTLIILVNKCVVSFLPVVVLFHLS